MITAFRVTLTVTMWGCFAFGVLYFGFLFLWRRRSVAMLAAPRASTRPEPRERTASSALLPGVTMVMPGYNEEVTIVGAVAGVLSMDYPDLEVIVVNDGSSDRTVALLVEHYDMGALPGEALHGPIHCEAVRAVYRSRRDHRLVLIDKDPAGAKADGANCAINYATNDWCVVMDADELVAPDAVMRCMTEIAHTAGNVIAAGVTLLPTNECEIVGSRVVTANVARNPWVGMQTVEYFGAFLLSRPGMSTLGALPIVSGGFGLFRRDALVRVGGYRHPSLGEDLDMAVRLHRAYREAGEDYRIIQVPDAICWTEFPFNRTVLRRQRIRWHRGLRQVLRDHRRVILNPHYGRFGMLGMANMFVFEWVAALVEAAGYAICVLLAATGNLNAPAALAFLACSQVVGLYLSVTAVRSATRFLDVYQGWRNAVRLLGWAVCMQFGYRQLTLLWRVRSLLSKNTTWGAMPRAGF